MFIWCGSKVWENGYNVRGRSILFATLWTVNCNVVWNSSLISTFLTSSIYPATSILSHLRMWVRYICIARHRRLAKVCLRDHEVNEKISRYYLSSYIVKKINLPLKNRIWKQKSSFMFSFLLIWASTGIVYLCYTIKTKRNKCKDMIYYHCLLLVIDVRTYSLLLIG